jgi:hypothetical protein
MFLIFRKYILSLEKYILFLENIFYLYNIYIECLFQKVFERKEDNLKSGI